MKYFILIKVLIYKLKKIPMFILTSLQKGGGWTISFSFFYFYGNLLKFYNYQ